MSYFLSALCSTKTLGKGLKEKESLRSWLATEIGRYWNVRGQAEAPVLLYCEEHELKQFFFKVAQANIPPELQGLCLADLSDWSAKLIGPKLQDRYLFNVSGQAFCRSFYAQVKRLYPYARLGLWLCHAMRARAGRISPLTVEQVDSLDSLLARGLATNHIVMLE